MSYSPALGSSMTNTKMRTPNHISPFSGMCAVCSANCTGTCEIGLSATRGSEAIYPFKTDINQFASEKDYPLDFSHFNINGRVFGARGCEEDATLATFPNANMETTFGQKNQIKLKAPIILPALAKLNWRDYFAGAALSGLLAVIGESAVTKDKGLVLEDGKVVDSPLLRDMVSSFKQYYRGYGDIILQANYDDENLGVLDYAIKELGIKSVELKFGQAAKGIQGMGMVDTLEEALRLQEMGYIVHPDPSDPVAAENHKKGIGKGFEKVDKLPMWNEQILANRIAELRDLGAEHICFKTGPYDPEDLVRIIKIASANEVDLITFDGGGGGSGNSPSKMMNEWGIPTVYMESMLYNILDTFKEKKYQLPQVAIAGGFTMEDHVYKGLALAAPYVDFIGMARGPMAAAFSGQQIGELIEKGNVPKEFQRFGTSKEEIFTDLRELKLLYGDEADDIPTGAIGVYSYINRISTGMRQLLALNRKFDVKYIDRSDLSPLTKLAAKISGLPTYEKLAEKALDSI